MSFVNISKNNSKPIILFGSGNIALKTIRKLRRENISFIVDNSSNLQETTYDGFEVKSPSAITNDYFVVICSTAISDIAGQLESIGLHADKDFVLSPILNDLLAISELEELNKVIYFTSGTVPKEEKNAGGGLYRCHVKGLDVTLECLYSGSCYGMIERKNEIIFVDTDKGIFSYCRDQKVVERIGGLPHGSRAHGISFNEFNNKYYVSCSNADQVLELNCNFEVTRKFKLSNKYELNKQAMHHCNDNLALGNSLYVSMFSSSGNWKHDCFDGCIAEFDISTGERMTNIYSNLYMPHNVQFFNGSLHILDSLPGHLRFGNFSIQGTFPAFTRGLSYSAGLYYIGQSKNRNHSKVMGLSNNISIDCGIIVFNPELKVSRFLQFPFTIGEIHSILTFEK